MARDSGSPAAAGRRRLRPAAWRGSTKKSAGPRSRPSRRAISSSSSCRRAGMPPRRTQPLTAVCQMPSSSATRCCEPNLRMTCSTVFLLIADRDLGCDAPTPDTRRVDRQHEKIFDALAAKVLAFAAARRESRCSHADVRARVLSVRVWCNARKVLRWPQSPAAQARPALAVPHLCRAQLGPGQQRALPHQPRARADRPLGRLRPADPDRLRQRPPAGRRARSARSACRSPRSRHGDPVRRHPARADEHLDDHQRHRPLAALALHRGGPAAGRATWPSCRARSRTTSSRNICRAGPTSTRPSPRCG